MMKLYCLMALLVLQASSAFGYAFRDSIGLERRDDQIYILHRIDPGETIYSVTQRYKTTAETLRLHNPSVDFYAFKIGQIVRIPAPTNFGGGYTPIQGNSGTAATVGSSKRVVGYIIRSGDYIYKIAQTYGTTLERIMELNNMKDDKLSIGQTILIEIAQNVNIDNTAPDNVAKQEEPKNTNQVSNEDAPWWAYRPATDGGDKKADPKKEDAADVLQKREDDKSNFTLGTGKTNVPTNKRAVSFGEMIQGNSMVESSKLLAMHSTARVGTFIKVTNTNNGKTAVVKVIATIPASESKDVSIKLSKAVCDALGIKEAKFQVLLEYND